jgi:hypothetical protein
MGRSGEEGVLVNRIVIVSGPDSLVQFVDDIFIRFVLNNSGVHACRGTMGRCTFWGEQGKAQIYGLLRIEM